MTTLAIHAGTRPHRHRGVELHLDQLVTGPVLEALVAEMARLVVGPNEVRSATVELDDAGRPTSVWLALGRAK